MNASPSLWLPVLGDRGAYAILGVCESYAVAGAPDITLHGSWQAYAGMQEAPARDRSPAL